jgi:hypothetical protein
MSNPALEPPAGVTRPIVFFDIMIGDTPAGRIKMGTSAGRDWLLEHTTSLFSSSDSARAFVMISVWARADA